MRRKAWKVFLFGLLFSFNAIAQTEFITTWQTDNPGTSGNTQITIPTTGTGYNYDVDWDNDGTFDEFGLTGNVTHDFGTAGTYTIRIQGTFPQMYFNNGGDRRKIVDVSQWGDIPWTSGSRAFFGCENLIISATDTLNLSGATSIARMFRSCYSLVGANLAGWDVSNIQYFNYAFQDAYAFNGNISNWNTSSGINMLSMFRNCSSFNQDLNNWDVSNSTTLNSMFRGCGSFNQDLNNWNLQSDPDIARMFEGCSSFNGDVTTWDITGIDDMEYLFSGCTQFNQNLNSWDVSLGNNFTQMFYNASSYNQPMDNWDTGSCGGMASMFSGATSFNQDISSWDMSNVASVSNMFAGVTLSTANYDSLLVGWSAQTLQPNLTFSGGNSLYCSADAERQSIISTYGWTIADGGQSCPGDEYIITVKTDNPGTTGTTEFEIPATGSGLNYNVDWDNDGIMDEYGLTAAVTHDFGTAGTYTIRVLGNLPKVHFNNGRDGDKLLSIDQWGTQQWTNMNYSYAGCENMVINAADNPDLTFCNTMSFAFSAAAISGNVSGWDVSNVNSFLYAFANTPNFNDDISGWDVSNVHTFTGMFNNSPSFNQDISGWDMSGASNVSAMFREAYSFDQNLGAWDMSGITNASTMFYDVQLSTANYDAMLTAWNAQNLQPGVTFDGGNSFYCASVTDRANMISVDGWTITDGGEECPSDHFVTTWKTDNPGTSGATEITIPTTGSGYNYDIDWDNDGAFDEFGVNGAVTHDFGSAGTYTIRIRGSFPRIYFNYSGDREKILSVDQWGTTQWSAMNKAFSGCVNLHINATDAPDLSGTNDMYYMFEDCDVLNEDISSWDVSNIQFFEGLFSGCNLFNQPLNSWDVSNGVGMSSMLQFNSNFNQDLSSWDLGNVVNTSFMFRGCAAFNQDVSAWNTGMLIDIEAMFDGCTSFDQDLSDWDVTNVTDAKDFLKGATLSTANYDSLLIGWNVQVLQPNVTFSGGNSLFCSAFSERQNMETVDGWMITDGGMSCPGEELITVWKTDHPGSSGPTEITIPTTGVGYSYHVDWDNDGIMDTLGVTGNITHDFGVTDTFTVRILGEFPQMYFNNGGDRRKILDVTQWGDIVWSAGSRAFYGCSNMVISATDYPDLSNVTAVDRMLRECDNLIGTNLTNWQMGNVHEFNRMFEGSNNFNGDIGNWDVSSATNMLRMFQWCPNFNQDLNAWDVSACGQFQYMFSGCSSLNQNFDNWNVQTGNQFQYMFQNCSSFNGDVTTWTPLNGDNFRNMFQNCGSFNQNLNNWDVSDADDFRYMFVNATTYNQPMNNWNTSGVTSVDGMFQGATSFDQDLSAWDVTSLTAAPSMFQGVTLSITNYDALLIGWDAQALQAGVVFSGGDSEYCQAGAERTNMMTASGWTITDGGLESSGPTPDIASLTDITGVCEVTSLTAPTATDNCTASVTVTNNATFPITEGTTTVTWTYTDGNGNITTQDQTVIVNDTTAPVADLSTLADIVAECEVVSLTAPTATDECAASVIVTNDAVLPITVQGTTVVTWTYDDGHGNTATQTQNVVITDLTAPVPDVASLSDINTQCEVTSLTAPTAADNCASTVNVTHNASLPITAQGTTVVTWTYDDGNGNTITQDQQIIIADTATPVPDVASLSDINTQCEVTSLTAPTATDNCASTVNVTHNASLPITAQGTTVVTWTYDDGNGNTITQDQQIIISDTATPVPDVVSLSAIHALCEVTSLTAPTATDNCVGAITATTTASLPITTTTTVTWTYDDGNGNTITQDQNIVIDGVDVSTAVSANGIMIMANNTGATSYQWIDCGNGNVPLPGATNSDFVAMANGDYAVIITEGGCTDTSACVNVSTVGVDALSMESFTLYPNPTTTGMFAIDYDGDLQQVDVFDMLGRSIPLPIDLENKTVDGSVLVAGKYIVRVVTESDLVLQKEIIVAP